jgi:hypothetical protein
MKWISVVILLVALSMVNASPFHIYKRDTLHKRAVALVPCKEPSKIVLTGSIDPDPVPGTPAKSTLTFTTTEDVPELFLTTTVAPEGGDAAKAKVTTADLCAAESGLTCPVPKGKEVTVTSTTDIPADIAPPYTVEFNFHNAKTVVSCGVAKVAKAAEGGAAPKGDEPKADEPKADEPKGGDAPEEPKGGDPPPEEPEEPKGGPPPEEPKEPPKEP